MKHTFLLFLLIFGVAMSIFPQTVSIANIQVEPRTNGSGFLDVYFDLSGSESIYDISLEVSFDAGNNFAPVAPTCITGEIGPVQPGAGKHLIWDGICSNSETYSTQTKIKLIATFSGGACGNPYTDPRDGKTYNTVQIGTQCWMAENMNYESGNSWCYDDDPANCNTYGRLYDWETALGVCPPSGGWHLPSDGEWCTLENWVDAGTISCNSTGWRGVDAGHNLKSVSGWNYNGNGTNLYGFNALPGGRWDDDGYFSSLNLGAYFWSASVESGNKSWNRYLFYQNNQIRRLSYANSNGFSVRCVKDEQNQAPSQPDNPVPTNGEIDVELNTTLSWTCTDPENDPLTYDVYFGSSNPPPLVSSNQSNATYDPGTLNLNTTYYWQIISHDDNTNQTTGSVWDFTTIVATSFQCGDQLIDTRDGKTYSTIQIGTQCWMAENLNVGTRIDGVNEQTNNSLIEKYCYDDDPANCDVYGALYEWNELMQYSIQVGTQGICPNGWHIPSDSEFCSLANYLDATVDCESVGYLGTDAGGKMKTTGTIQAGTGLWNAPNLGATNASNFSGIPAGIRTCSGSFAGLGNYLGLWSSSAYYTNAWTWELNSGHPYPGRGEGSTCGGFSVRCLKDEQNQAPSQPDNPVPTNGEIDVELNTTLSWTCTDPENDPLTYDVYFGSSNPPPLVSSNQSNATYDPGTLNLNTTYYWQIISHDDNTNQTTGSVWSFTTFETVSFQCGDILIDTRDGQSYNTIQIGTQCWMAENLNYESGNSWCYDDDPANCNTYGRLYDWETALNICPPTGGWHLPSDEEWKILEGTVDSQYGLGDPEWDNINWRGMDAGLNLKSNSGWNNNGNGTDLYDFGARPGGYRDSFGNFYKIDAQGFWWSASAYSETNAWSRSLYYSFDGSGRGFIYRISGYSVRCLKN